MNCPVCGQENPNQAKFCLECGTRLVVTCAACGTELPSGAKFCLECGAPVAAGGLGTARFTAPRRYIPHHLAQKILTSRSFLEGERKQVTVLFADLKGSLELLADRDPEEARAILDPVLERMMEAVHRYEGTVNQVMGDGIMALFGAPIAHEDHAVRACYAALRMQEAMQQYADQVWRSHGVPIQIRVGLNAGEVVVRSIGSDLHMDYTAVGQTTHLAARMEQIATPGTILLTPELLRLAEGYVQVRARGPVQVRGLAQPLEVFELLGPGPLRTRLQAAAARGLTRFVGREAELEVLRRTLELAGAGRGQVVALVGEPGVGKSRLVWEFIHSHRTEGWLALEASSVSYGKATSYLPVIDLLKSYAGIEDQDDQRRVRERLTGKVLALDEALRSTLPALCALLDVSADDSSWRELDPVQRRERTLDAIRRLLLRESQVQPLLLIFEDLHWIDAETQAVLDRLVESLPGTHLLLLVSYRPEYQHTWGSKTYYTQLRLDPLPPATAEELLGALLGTDPALDPVKRLLIARTEGNPFFLEESVRTLVETGMLAGERGAYRPGRPRFTTQVPATVQAVLAARIDRLPPEEKRLLQTAAVIGKDVPFGLLQAIAEERAEDSGPRIEGHPSTQSPVLSPQLSASLERLQTAEFLYETSLFPELEYTFKHALTYEVAYSTMLADRRRGLHGRILAALEARDPERWAEQVEQLAHHAWRGEVWDRAVDYLHQAGRKASARSAHREAEVYFEQALEALAHLPASPEALQWGIDIRLDLGPVLIATRGSAAPEVDRVYAEARAACEQLREPPQLFPVLWGQARTHDRRGELEAARQIGEQLLAVARRGGDAAQVLEAHHTLWSTLPVLGDYAAGRAHAEEGLALYDPDRHGHLAQTYAGHDPGVCGWGGLARILWVQGYPDQARAHMQRGLDLAGQLAHAFSRGFAFSQAAWLDQHCGDLATAAQRVEGMFAVAAEHEFLPHRIGSVVRGLLLGEEGHYDAAIAHLRELASLGGQRDQSYIAIALAEVCRQAGAVEDGLWVVTEAAERATQSGERAYDAELYRVRGELFLAQAQPDAGAAEASFQQALSVARAQGAKAYELRAAMSLARLWGRQGEHTRAHDLLAELYAWFTEGFETADLKKAKALLDDLS